MSREVDERIVSMQFDNRQFERATAESMSTIDKFNKKLRFDGASRGIEALEVRFSHMQATVQHQINRIVDNVVNMGTRIAKALTIDPVKTGLQEYETQINAVQTILANTQSKGTTLDQVNAALDELNEYADLTIYNFTEMTRNIGTFTAAGVDLETSVNAIQGIANLAAVSGSTSQQASTAMYQLSQALAAGTIRLMDWNSVVNAGMGGELFQNALRKTSELLGTGAEKAIKATGSFRESLREEWLTAEVMTETLKKFTTTGAVEYLADYTGMSQEAVKAETEFIAGAENETEAIEKAAEALAKKSGKNKEEIKDALQLAYTAQNAATKVKTFSQMWDVLKETAQSGWAQTWRLVFGDFEEAKKLFTPLTQFFQNIITSISDFRNNLIKGALDSPFGKLYEKIKGVSKVTETLNEKTKDYQDIVNRIINGEFGTYEKRWNKLTEMGYDWKHAQNLVNEQLGNSYRRETDYVEEQVKSQKDLKEAREENLETLVKLSDETLKQKGFTEEEIKALRELEQESKKSGKSMLEIMETLGEMDGRTRLIETFKNAGKGLVKIFKALKDAWIEVFPPMTATHLGMIIASIHEFSKKLVMSDETATNLKNTFKGLFSILGFIKDIAGGALKIAFKVLNAVLSAFDTDLLSVTGTIGDAIYKFRQFAKEHDYIGAAIKWVVDILAKAVKAVGKWISSFAKLDNVQAMIESFKENLEKIKDVGSDVIAGFKEGLLEGVKSIPKILVQIGKTLLDAICDILGIHSPSKAMIFVGSMVIAGLIIGLISGIPQVKEAMNSLGQKISENEFFATVSEKLKNGFASIDWDKVFSAGMTIALLVMGKKMTDAVSAFSAPFEGLGELLSATAGPIASVIRNFAQIEQGVYKLLKSKAFDNRMEGIKKLAISLGILIAAFVGMVYVFKKMDVTTDDLLTAGAVIVVLAGVLIGMSIAVSKISESSAEITKEGAKINGMLPQFLAIATSILIMAGAVAIIGGMNKDSLTKGFIGLAAIVIAMMAMVKIVSKFVQKDIGKDFRAFGKMVRSIAGSILLLVIVTALINLLSPEAIAKGVFFVGGFTVFVLALTAISRLAGPWIDDMGKMVKRISTAVLLMTIAVGLIGLLSYKTLLKGALFLAGFLGFVAGLVAITYFASGKKLAKVNGLVMAVSTSVILMAGAVGIIGMLSPKAMIKGAIFLTGFLVFLGLLVGITAVAGQAQIAKASGVILAASFAIGILAVVAMILSIMSLESLAKGITAISIMGTIMAIMVASTKGIGFGEKAVGVIIGMASAIAVMALAIAALAFIDSASLAIAAASLGGVMLACAAVMASLAKVKVDKEMLKSVGIMMAIVIALGGIVYVLSLFSSEDSLKNATAVSELLIALSASMVILGKVGNKAKKAAKNLPWLLITVAGLAAIMWAMSTLNIKSVPIENIAGMSLLLLAMTASMVILSKARVNAKNAVLGALALTAMAVPLLALVGVLALMQGVDNATRNANLLTKMATVLTLLLIPISLIGFLIGATGGLMLLGIAALTLMLVPMLGIVGVLALMQGVDKAAQNGDILIRIMTVMGDLLVKISLLAPLAIVGVIAVAAFEGLIIGFGLLATALGALTTKYPDIEKFLDKGMDLLIKLADGIGKVVGTFLSSALTTFAKSLPGVGADLSVFMTNASGFIEGAKSVDEQVIDGVKRLAGAIVLLTAADFISNMLSLTSNGSTLAELGTDLSKFMTNANQFIQLASQIKPESMAGIESLAKGIMILTAADFLSGIVSFMDQISSSGGTFADFGTELSDFMVNANMFTVLASQLKPGSMNAMKTLAEAIMIITSADLIERIGSWLKGESSLSEFGTGLGDLGTGLNDFITNVGTFTEDQLNTVDVAVKALKKIAEAAAEIPNAGGVLGAFVGNNDLSTFANDFGNLGSGLRQFIENLQKNDVVFDPNLIETACGALTTIAKAASDIPNAGGILADLIGDNELEKFADQFPTLGEGLAGFAEKIGTFTETELGSINTGIRALKAIASISALDLPTVIQNLGGLGSQLNTFGDQLSEFMTSLGNVDPVLLAAAFTNVKMVGSYLNELKDIDPDIGANFNKAIKDLANTGLNAFIDTFSSDVSNASVIEAGKNMIAAFTSGLEANIDDVETASADVSTAGATAAGSDDIKSLFIGAGEDLGSGLVVGINNKWQAAYDAGYALGEAAVLGEKAGQQSESPSKLTIQAGKWLGEGLVIGINRMGNAVYRAGHGMGEKATESISGAISRTVDFINSDIDAQPTIRPVLDLSDVRAGAGAINSMFNSRAAVNVAARVGAISSSMNARSQNGVNDDVVSALNKLRKDIGNIGGNTIQIGDVTYDDGSNVSSAVNDLVRALRMEGRS